MNVKTIKTTNPGKTVDVWVDSGEALISIDDEDGTKVAIFSGSQARELSEALAVAIDNINSV